MCHGVQIRGFCSRKWLVTNLSVSGTPAKERTTQTQDNLQKTYASNLGSQPLYLQLYQHLHLGCSS